MKRVRLPSHGVYLGHGFPWTVRHRQQYERIVSEGLSTPSEVGIWTLQGLVGTGSSVTLSPPLLSQHLFLSGTTGSGKTRLLELLALQAIRRGEAVVLIDPKGDRDLQRRLGATTRIAPHEKSSPPYNPLACFDEPRQVADRLAAMLPSEGEAQAFRNFAWQVVARVATGIHSVGEPMSLIRLREYAFGSLEVLARKVLEKARPGMTLRSYRRRRGLQVIDGILELLDHPREHYLKLTSGLSAALSKLTAGSLRGCLSREGFSWDRLVDQRGVAILEFPTLRGADTARALSRMALVDLQHAIARWPASPRTIRLSLFIDEFSDLAMPEFIDVLNKARGSGVSITVATQTFSDLRATLGSEARAMQIIGNASTVVQFRTHDETDARLFSDIAGREPARILRRSQSFEPALFTSGSKWVDDYRATFTLQTEVKDEPVVPPYLVHQLPNLHAFARVGGRLYKLMVPVISGDA